MVSQYVIYYKWLIRSPWRKGKHYYCHHRQELCMINDELSFDLLGRSYPQNDDEKTGKRNKENDGPYAEDIL